MKKHHIYDGFSPPSQGWSELGNATWWFHDVFEDILIGKRFVFQSQRYSQFIRNIGFQLLGQKGGWRSLEAPGPREFATMGEAKSSGETWSPIPRAFFEEET